MSKKKNGQTEPDQPIAHAVSYLSRRAFLAGQQKSRKAQDEILQEVFDLSVMVTKMIWQKDLTMQEKELHERACEFVDPTRAG